MGFSIHYTSRREVILAARTRFSGFCGCGGVTFVARLTDLRVNIWAIPWNQTSGLSREVTVECEARTW